MEGNGESCLLSGDFTERILDLMNDILSYCAGIFTALLIVAIPLRVWRGKFFVLLFGLSLLSAQASTYVNINNNTGSSVHISSRIVFSFDGGAGQAVSGASGSSIAAGATMACGAAPTIGSGQTLTVYFDGAAIGSVSAPGGFAMSGGPGFNPIANATLNLSGGFVTYTNHVASINWTNTTAGADYTLKFYTNGVLATNVSGYFGTTDSYVRSFTNLFGVGQAFTWEIVGPGSAENDYAPVVVASGSSTGTVSGTSSGSSGAATSTSTPGNPIASVPQQGTNTIPVDTSVAARQNAEAIVRTIEKQGSFDTERILAGLERNRTNSTAQSPDMSWTNLLGHISTNTANTTNLLGALLSSNFHSGAAGFLSAAVDAAMSAATNGYDSTPEGQMIADAISGVLATDTNQVVAAPSTNALARGFVSPSGQTLYFNANLLTTAVDSVAIASVKGQIVKLLQWLHGWILKLLPFVMFWLFTNQVLAWQKDLMGKGFVSMPKGLDLSPWKLAAKIPMGIAAGVIVGFILGFVPTGVISYMQGISMSAAIPSLADHIQNSGVTGARWLGSMVSFWGYINEAIPFTTVIFCCAHYAAFQLYGVKLVQLVNTVLARLGFVLGCIAFAFVPVSEAAQLEVWNLSGTNVWFSNSVSTAQLCFPSGGPFILNIESGEWVVRETNVVEFPVSEDRYVLRVDLAGVVSSMAESEWSWFWAGVVHWVPIFGLLATASVLRGFLSQSLSTRFPSSD